MSYLILSFEPSPHYLEQSRGATELQPALKEIHSDFVFETLPMSYENALSKAKALIEEHNSAGVILLSNAPNNMEVVLYNHGSPIFDNEFPDNDGKTIDPLPADSKTFLPKKNIMMAYSGWMAAANPDNAQVTMGMGNDGGIEAYVYYKLMEKFDEQDFPVLRLGVPPIAPEHQILKPEAIVATLSQMITSLTD